ncbi:MAG: insulinase family protein, partial [Caulobacteraceae bacterium]
MHSFRAAMVASLWLAFGGSGAALAETAPKAPLIADPAIRYGVLPNGLRYGLMSNATPAGGLSLRLAFDVGSLDEAESERGVVLAERDVRNEPAAAVTRAIEVFTGPDLRTTQRPPIGDLQVLRTISPAALQAFYGRWYRPEHAVLVV